MVDPADDTTIDLPLETPEATTTVVEAAPEPTPKPAAILEPEVGLEKLKKQLDDEKRAAKEATARATAAEADAAAARNAETAARTEAQTSNLHAVNAAISAVTQAMDAAEAAYAEALSVGDHGRAAKLNREMNQNAARLSKLEDNKTAIETAPKPTPRPTSAPTNDVERIASQLSPRSASWVRAHPEYASGAKYNEMVAAHNLALARGKTVESDEYFATIERILDLNAPPVAPAEAAAAIDTAPQQATGGRNSAPAPAAAPVSRGGTGNGSKPRTMTLTKDMREMASMMGMTDQDYAKYRQQLIDEGAIH
jgi:hypothetical protein